MSHGVLGFWGWLADDDGVDSRVGGAEVQAVDQGAEGRVAGGGREAPVGHHREGLLAFAQDELFGRPVAGDTAQGDAGR